jgi:cyclase
MNHHRVFAVLALLAGLPVLGHAQPPGLERVEVVTEKVAEGVYMLKGAGGNIGLSVGEDAAFLVDDQYAPLTPKIKAAVAALTAKPVKFVLNTHWHGDHTGGNGNLGAAGTLILFRKANVLHTGDLVFNGMYPFIDVDSGGSVSGMVAAADTLLAIVTDGVKIIPGHGPLASKADEPPLTPVGAGDS